MNKALYRALADSQVLRDYEESFRRATGLWQAVLGSVDGENDDLRLHRFHQMARECYAVVAAGVAAVVRINKDMGRRILSFFFSGGGSLEILSRMRSESAFAWEACSFFPEQAYTTSIAMRPK